MQNIGAKYQKIVFIALLFLITLFTFNGLIDFNLLPRFFMATLLGMALIVSFKRLTIEVDSAILLLFYFYNLLSCIWAEQLDFALFESQRVLLYFLAYIIFKHSIKKGGLTTITRTISIIALCLVIVNVSIFLLNGASFYKYNTTAAHPNLLASSLLLCLPFSGLQFIDSKSKSWKYLAFVSIILIVGMILFLGTRSVIIGLLIGGSIGLGIMLKRHSRKIFYGFIISIGLAISLVLILLVFNISNWDTTTLHERLFIWNKTLSVVQDNPIIGTGSGNWMFQYPKYGLAGFSTFEDYGLVMQRPHNDVLWVLAELGIIGFSIMLFFFISVFKSLTKMAPSNTKIILLIGIISFIPVTLFSFPKERIEHIFLFFGLMAIVSSLSPQKNKAFEVKYLKIPVIGLLLFSLIVISYNIKGAWYTQLLLTHQKDNKPREVIKNYHQASSIFYAHTLEGMPLATYAGGAHAQLGEMEEVYYYSHKAYLEAPNNYEVLSNLGMALNAQKQYGNAEKILLKAYAIQPSYDGTIFNIAIVKYNQKQFKAAKIWIDRVHNKSKATEYYSGLIHKKLGIE